MKKVIAVDENPKNGRRQGVHVDPASEAPRATGHEPDKAD
jgi:hypothetical protein